MGKFKKVLKKIAPIAPIALSVLAPGFGTAIGTALGATGKTAGILGNSLLGAASGGLTGGAKGALVGGLTGGLSGGGGASIAKGLGASAANAPAFGKAIAGGLGGALSGGGLKGAALGAAGGYALGGGNIPGLGSIGGRLGPGGMGPPTPGTGLLGGLGKLTNASAAGGAQPMKLGSLLNAGGKLLSYSQGQDDIDDIQNILAQQSKAAQAQFQPYAQAGQTALANLQAPALEALQNDPGYQFRLQQGQQALDRSLAARGLSQSGAALKAAQEYGQGLADQTYNDYFSRQAQLANLGYGGASGLGSLNIGLGDAQAAALRAQIENRNNLLGGLFS